MSEPESYQKLKRCPVCFSREIDVLLVPSTNERDRHYCVKCSFSGTEAEINALYKDIQKKYHWMGRRVTLEEQERL